MRKSNLLKNNKKTIFYLFIVALTIRTMAIIGGNIVLKDFNLNRDLEYGLIARSLINGQGYSLPILETKDWNENTPKEVRGNIPEMFAHADPTEKGKSKNLKVTDNYRPSADQLPFYPMLLAVVYYFSNNQVSIWVIKIIQSIFSSITCLIIYMIAFKLFNQRIAVIAGIISVIYPVFILYTMEIFPETFFTFWLALSVLYLINFRAVPSLKYGLIAGVLLGITLLNSNVIFPMIPFICLWVLLLKGNWKEKFKWVMLLMVTAFLIVSPWLIRNYFVFGTFPLMKSTMGVNLWLGNNSNATGTHFLETGKPIYSILPKMFYEGFKFSETEQDKRLYDDAISYIKKNPMHFVKLSLKRFFYFTWFPPDNLISKKVKLYKKIFKLPYGFILISSIIGFILSFKKYPKEVLLIFLLICSVTFLYSIFIVGHLRYRMPIEPYIIIFSSYTIYAIWERILFYFEPIR